MPDFIRKTENVERASLELTVSGHSYSESFGKDQKQSPSSLKTYKYTRRLALPT